MKELLSDLVRHPVLFEKEMHHERKEKSRQKKTADIRPITEKESYIHLKLQEKKTENSKSELPELRIPDKSPQQQLLFEF